jgi:hypothetical protein
MFIEEVLSSYGKEKCPVCQKDQFDIIFKYCRWCHHNRMADASIYGIKKLNSLEQEFIDGAGI